MKIQLLRNPAREFGCELCEGDTGEVADKLAKKLIALGIAEPATQNKKTVKAVATKPVISETKSPNSGDK